jgi:ubiquinone/menaquinone biosynthesis C-methylase UbiE
MIQPSFYSDPSAMLFSRRFTRGTSPLAIAGVREGDCALQIGVDDPRLAAAIANRVGAQGHAAIVVADPDQADRAQAMAERGQVHIDVRLGALDALPFYPDSFDLVVVHAEAVAVDLDDLSGRAILRDVRRVLRIGGRVVILEGGTRDLLRRLSRRRISRIDTRLNTLRAAGFTAAELVEQRAGYRVFEAAKARLDT